eukprot:2432085-Prymnesium_polylepis.1
MSQHSRCGVRLEMRSGVSKCGSDLMSTVHQEQDHLRAHTGAPALLRIDYCKGSGHGFNRQLNP